jgi:hypothetical protein
MIALRSVTIALCFGLSIAGCGSKSDPQSEDYGNIIASPGGLILLEEEHPTGWGRSGCFGCHNVNDMHQVNRTGLTDEQVDLPGTRAIIANQGEPSCMLCHGDNGVQQ